MNYEQKAQALKGLGDLTIRFRKPGDWYASCEYVYTADSCFLVGAYGDGATPEKAVEAYFERLTELRPNEKYVVIDREPRRRLRWTGFMWSEVPE